MATITTKRTLLANIVHNLELLDNLPIDTPVAEVMADIDGYVDRLYIYEPGISKVRVNWAGTQHDRINLHVFVLHQETNNMAIFHAIITPGFTTYKLDVSYYNSFGSSYPNTDWRDITRNAIIAQLREQLG